MTIGEQLYLGLVLLSFLTFAAVLAVVSTRTNRYMRHQTAKKSAEDAQSDLKKVA